jgi:hypothetical protein
MMITEIFHKHPHIGHCSRCSGEYDLREMDEVMFHLVGHPETPSHLAARRTHHDHEVLFGKTGMQHELVHAA